MILFSVPVHENNDVVRDTLNNARKYNPGCIFVLHVSLGFHDFDFSIGEYSDVLINPIRFRTVHSRTSHVPLHFTNYIHAVNKQVNFNQVCILHTSEMFIKYGTEEYIKQYPYALWFGPNEQPRVDTWPPYIISFSHKIFKGLFDGNDPHNYVGNLIEGHWWNRELFEKMYNWTIKHYDMMLIDWPYACEEVFFATLGHHLSENKNYGIPYCGFYNKIHYVNDINDINDIRENKDVVIWQNNNWTYMKVPFPSKNLYSIKRISRELNDPIRRYINSLDT
jgi:hypothetical protein